MNSACQVGGRGFTAAWGRVSGQRKGRMGFQPERSLQREKMDRPLCTSVSDSDVSLFERHGRRSWLGRLGGGRTCGEGEGQARRGPSSLTHIPFFSHLEGWGSSLPDLAAYRVGDIEVSCYANSGSFAAGSVSPP